MHDDPQQRYKGIIIKISPNGDSAFLHDVRPLYDNDDVFEGSVFLHVRKAKALKTERLPHGATVTFKLAQSPSRPGKFEALDVLYYCELPRIVGEIVRLPPGRDDFGFIGARTLFYEDLADDDGKLPVHDVFINIMALVNVDESVRLQLGMQLSFIVIDQPARGGSPMAEVAVLL